MRGGEKWGGGWRGQVCGKRREGAAGGWNGAGFWRGRGACAPGGRRQPWGPAGRGGRARRGCASGRRRPWPAPFGVRSCHLREPWAHRPGRGREGEAGRDRNEAGQQGAGMARLEVLQVGADVREVLVAAAGVADHVDVLVGDLGARGRGSGDEGRPVCMWMHEAAGRTLVTTASSMHPPRSFVSTVSVPWPSLRLAMSPTTSFSMNWTTCFPCLLCESRTIESAEATCAARLRTFQSGSAPAP